MTDEKDTKKEETKKETTGDNKQTTEQKEPEQKKEKSEEVKKPTSTKVSENKEEAKKEEDVKIPELKPGMTVRVYQKIKELNAKGEEKERIQYFEGIIIAKKHGKEKGGTITVRKISDGVGVEKIFPLNLPTIDKIEIKKQARVRRAKLNFLKNIKKSYKKKLKEVKISK